MADWPAELITVAAAGSLLHVDRGDYRSLEGADGGADILAGAGPNQNGMSV